MSNDPVPRESPLSQEVERDGRSVHVGIYEDETGEWLLEVVDEFGNASVWDQPFATEQDALDEALETIREEGIESLIGFDGSVAHPDMPLLP